MKAILVGCGAMSAEWMRSAQELGIELAALVDVNPAVAHERAKEFALTAEVFSGFRHAMETVPADAVFDCTIPAVHREVALAAFERGLAVLQEKPLALTLPDAREVVAEAEAAGCLHVIIQNRRFKRGVRLLRRLIDEGVVGEITTVHADFFIAPYFGGFRETMPHVLLVDMAIHPFDVARYLTGCDADEVWCEEWNPPNSPYRFGASVTTLFRMAGGIRFSYRASWCAEGFPTSWEGSWRIIGTRGTLLWDGGEEVRGERPKSRTGLLSEHELVLPTRAHEPAEEETRGHYSVMRQFLRAWEGSGPPPETRSTDNLHSLAMVMAATESAEAGDWVKVQGRSAL